MNPPKMVEVSSSLSEPTDQVTEWTEDEGILFEIAVTELDSNSESYYDDIADRLPGKTVTDVVNYYLDSHKRSNPKNSAPMARKSSKPVLNPSRSVNVKLPEKNSLPPQFVSVSSVSEDKDRPKPKRGYRRWGPTSECSQKGPNSLSVEDGPGKQNSTMETKKTEISEDASDVLIYELLHPMQVRAEDCLLQPSVAQNNMSVTSVHTNVGVQKSGSFSNGVVSSHSSRMSENVAPKRRGRPPKYVKMESFGADSLVGTNFPKHSERWTPLIKLEPKNPPSTQSIVLGLSPSDDPWLKPKPTWGSKYSSIPPLMRQSVVIPETQSSLRSQNLDPSMNSEQSYNQLKHKSVIDPEGSMQQQMHAVKPVLESFPSYAGASSSNYLWHNPTHSPFSYQLNAVKDEPQDFSHLQNLRHQLDTTNKQPTRLPITIKNEPGSPSRAIIPSSYSLGMVKNEPQDSPCFQNLGRQVATMNTQSSMLPIKNEPHSPCTITAFSYRSGVVKNEPQDHPHFQESAPQMPLMSRHPSMYQLAVMNEPQELPRSQNLGPQMLPVNNHSSMFPFAIKNELQTILPTMSNQNSYHGRHWDLHETALAPTEQVLMPDMLSGSDNYLPFSMQQQQSVNIEPHGQSQVDNFSSSFLHANVHQVTSPWMADRVSNGDSSQQLWDQNFISHTALPMVSQHNWFGQHSSSTNQHAPGATSSGLPSSNGGASGLGYPF